jgi:hypothetical protein
MAIPQSPMPARPALRPGHSGWQHHLLTLLKTLPQAALTITQLVQISEQVVDGVVVYATPRAAQLFGYAHPPELVGRYLSHIHHPDDALVTRQYTLARLHHDWYPDPYPMRILRAPALEPVPVVKHVTQVLIDGVLTWITTHTPFDFAHPFAMPVSPAMVDRAGSAAERHLLGLAHVAHMDRVLKAHEGIIRQSMPWLLHQSDVHTTQIAGQQEPPAPVCPHGTLQQEAAPQPFPTATLTRVLEMAALSQRRRQYNLCLRCGWPWFSKVEAGRPRKCPDCGDKHWDRPALTRRGHQMPDSHGAAAP